MVWNIYGYNKSGLDNLKEGTKKSINWNNLILDTTSGGFILVMKILKRRVQDFMNGK